MRPASLVPDPAVVTLEQIVADDTQITLVVRAQQERTRCPVCAAPATRVHSWYTRRLQDVPWQGLAVSVRLHTRRWFCDNPHCARHIFTERLPTVAEPHSRRTARLATIVLLFGVAVGGAPGARLLAALGIAVSGDTLRRAVCASALPDASAPRVLGVDDWSIRKGRTYATILVDLERRRPVDLLSDASAESLATWLRAHPGAEIICRDRGGAYAEGARQGAPAAVQVADRWHLLANLGEMLERLLARHHTALRQVRPAEPPPTTDEGPAPPAPPAPSATSAPRRVTRAERERQERDARREARYREIHALRARGYGVRAICRHLHVHQATVRKYLDAPSCPHPAPRPGRARRLTPYVPYLRERWEADERRVPVLWAEIRERGFPGSWRRVQEQLGVWRREARAARLAATGAAGPPVPLPPLPAAQRRPPRQVAAWLVRAADDLTPAQQAYVAALSEACPAIRAAQALAQAFARLVRSRDATGLDGWLIEAEGCAVAEVRDFAAGIRRDQLAVQAALVHAWSSGQVEGQINRLKLVKRSMYGRAGLPLLRRRFLLAS
ncbi:MAG TPA: ISL3 family transposase [Thermomicrobiales bacterium]|nr:ISL3 family transposase [Thermomicrobiales bacterium]